MPPDVKPEVSAPAAHLAEGERIMTICNACRYCEGYCAVFPAMEKRLTFTAGDLRYLANLCHNCAECYYACQYAPPHEFAVNVPQVFAQVRSDSYKHYAWPEPLADFLTRRLAIAWLVAAAALYLLIRDIHGRLFYDVIPHGRMVAVFLAISALIAAAYGAGFLRFWKDTEESLARFFRPRALMRAARDVLTLANLSSGGAGCTYPSGRHSQLRRLYHHSTFYGFLLCFASTTVAAIDHFRGFIAPYPYASAPVILGTLGGIWLLIGAIGLYWLKRGRDPATGDAAQDRSDKRFLALLALTSVTGLALLIARETPLMPAMLLIHLAIVLLLFLTLPYGKFVHGMYRSAALVKAALENPARKSAR